MSLHDYELVVGLEIHCQLATRSKLFTDCPFDTGGEPNTRVDPFTLGWPGTLPVPNAEAVRLATRLALALDCELQAHSRFARKHYFYPDLPHGYQITQADAPYAKGGAIPFAPGKALPLERIHMESDAGKTTHGVREGVSGVDYNRAGAPLVEIVSLPALRSAKDAAEVLRSLRQLVRWLGVSEGDMEKGSLRCDANVSLRPRGVEALGTRCEIKNLNSFKFLEAAIGAEARRQADLLDRGEAVVQSTMAYEVDADRTWVMRSKEDAADYLYFPEPDLPPLRLEAAWLDAQREALPELPGPRRDRYLAAGLSDYDAEQLTADRATGDYFDAVCEAGAGAKAACNWIIGELAAAMKAEKLEMVACPVTPAQLAEIIALVEADTINGRAAKQVFEAVFAGEGAPREIVERKGLGQVSDRAALEAVVAEILAAHPDQLAALRGGKAKLRGFFVGQVMKQTRGRANPQVVQALLDAAIAER